LPNGVALVAKWTILGNVNLTDRCQKLSSGNQWQAAWQKVK